jgi:C1A family cysteine protease
MSERKVQIVFPESIDSESMRGYGEKVVGKHAVLAVGFNDSHQRFLARNSWGADWGMRGYFTMPYQHLLDDELSADFRTIRIVT